MLLYSVDIKTGGSLSLLVSLPTMLVAFARYSRDGSFAVLGANLRFVAVLAAGSVTGAVLGGLLLGVIPDLVLTDEQAFVLARRWPHLGLGNSDDFATTEAMAAITRITNGNFRLTTRLVDQIERVLEINQLSTVTKEVVEAARENPRHRNHVRPPPTNSRDPPATTPSGGPLCSGPPDGVIKESLQRNRARPRTPNTAG